jgi:hypothetical protein
LAHATAVIKGFTTHNSLAVNARAIIATAHTTLVCNFAANLNIAILVRKDTSPIVAALASLIAHIGARTERNARAAIVGHESRCA